MDSFSTDKISLKKFEIKPLKAYWKTAGIDPGVYTVKANVHYDQGSTSGEGEINVGFKFESSYLIILIAIIMVILIGYFLRKKYRRKK